MRPAGKRKAVSHTRVLARMVKVAGSACLGPQAIGEDLAGNRAHLLTCDLWIERTAVTDAIRKDHVVEMGHQQTPF